MSGDGVQKKGTHCKSDASGVIPRVDPAKCEAKGECVKVCPYEVFEINVDSNQEKSNKNF